MLNVCQRYKEIDYYEFLKKTGENNINIKSNFIEIIYRVSPIERVNRRKETWQ